MIKIKFDKPLNENQIELLVKVAERYNCAVGGSDANVTITSAGDDATFNVFTRRQEGNNVTIRHFWGGEMNRASSDPGQDPRGAPDLMPLWTILDVTPEGRGTDWYPKLNY